MPIERVQRRIDRLLDQAEEAADRHYWDEVRSLVEGIFRFDPDNEDARLFLDAAARDVDISTRTTSAAPGDTSARNLTATDPPQPTSFASCRYTVSRLLGEGGKKKVYRACDNTLDRYVAFALIKIDVLDETGRERVRREAQAMRRMGTQSCIIPIYDLGEEPMADGTLQPLMGGGDAEGLIEDPDVQIRDKAAVHSMRIREVVDPAERERVWGIALAAYPPYQDYQERTDRLIPVFAEPSRR
jgi:hypothetical protein